MLSSFFIEWGGEDKNTISEQELCHDFIDPSSRNDFELIKWIAIVFTVIQNKSTGYILFYV